MPRKQAIEPAQRQALRAWYQKSYPKPSQKQCIAWFLNKFGHKISQSTVSESLSKAFADLDHIKISNNRLKEKSAAWPALEKILLEWQVWVEKKGMQTTGDLIQSKARQIWYSLPEYQNQPIPEFSAGWLTRFKQRYHIKSRIQHGEAQSVSPDADKEMEVIREIATLYSENDIYNMDETGLFWRMTPSRGLSTQSQPGVKKIKSRVTLVFCCNASGNNRFRPWILGNAKKPRVLRNVNVYTMGG